MNLELIQSVGQNYPEDFDGILDCISIATNCSFNRYGTLLAVGCSDGRVCIWDFITRSIAKIITAHVFPISSLSWSRNGHYLLSASTDNTVCVWHVLTGDCERTYRFPAAVLRAQFHPRNSRKFLVTILKYPIVVINMDDDNHPKIIPPEEDDMNFVSSFDHRGNYIFTGNNRGRVVVYKTDTLTAVASFRLQTNNQSPIAVRQIEFARKSDLVLINSGDRIIRVYDATEIVTFGLDCEPEPLQRLQDQVNKTMWKCCTFSGDAEYVCAGSARQHSLYIWEKSTGTLVKILHGTKGEMLMDIAWHPLRALLCSVSNGTISVWAEQQAENWSAFAPDFKELDENVEYEERESEFDVEDEDRDKDPELERRARDGEQDTLVDVVSIEPIPQLLSSDEENEDDVALLHIPVAPEIEDPEEAPIIPGGVAAAQETTESESVSSMSVAGGSLKRSTGGATGEQENSTKRKRTAASGTGANNSRVVNIDLPGNVDANLHPMMHGSNKRSGERSTSATHRASTSVGGGGAHGGSSKSGKASGAGSSSKSSHNKDRHKKLNVW